MTSSMSPAVSSDDVFVTRSVAARRGMDLLRVNRYESLQTTRRPSPPPPQLTATSPRRRSEPFDVAPFSLSGDSSPLIDEYPSSRPMSSAITQLSAAGAGRGSGGLLVGGGYMSDSSTSKKKERKVKQNTLTLSSDKRRSKSPIERAAAAAATASNSSHFLAHRSTSFIAGASRSTSYEEELEDRLDNIRVGASLWQQRAAMERTKRLALAEQLAEQEHCYRTMMENFREQEEQKYERLKNRARVLMRRSEHLRAEKLQLEAKLSQALEKSVDDRKTFEIQISKLTAEVERLKETADAKRLLEEKALPARRKSDDDCEWVDQYKRLFEIALKRIKHLEQFRCAQDGRSPSALFPNGTRKTVNRYYSSNQSCRAKRRSSSCPTLLPSSGRDPAKLQVRLHVHSDDKQSSLCASVKESLNSSEANRLTSSAENTIDLPEDLRTLSVTVSHTLSPTGDSSYNNNGLKQDVEQKQFVPKESETFESVPTSAESPVRSGRPMSLNNYNCQAPTVSELSSKHTASIRKWYSEACASSSSRKLTNKKLDSVEQTSAAGDRAFKPRRIVSTSRMELFRKLPNFGPGLETLECRARSSAGEFKSDSFPQPNNELPLEIGVESDNNQEQNPVNFADNALARGGDEIGGLEEGCVSKNLTNEKILLDEAPTEFHGRGELAQVEHGQYDQGGASGGGTSTERGHSSFDRLRHRRNGLTSARNFQIKPAASCSRLDQIAKSIKTRLH